MDERLRQLEQQAELGDLEAQIQLINQLKLTNQLPENLALIIDFIDPFYRYQYYSIIKFLMEEGIPFEFRPESRCNCENMACADLKDHPILKSNFREYSRCEKCQEELDTNKLCINRRCDMLQKPQYTVGPCSRISWRAYDSTIGGLCDICGSRSPAEEYHGRTCNCPTCGTGIGPFILLRSRLLSADSQILYDLWNNYNNIFLDERTVTQPLIEELNTSPQEEQRMVRDAALNWHDHLTILERYEENRTTRFLNNFGTSLIEILPNGLFRLRMLEHLNEKAIKVFTYKRDMKFCQSIEKRILKSITRFSPRITKKYHSNEHQKFLDACLLLKTHYLGLDPTQSEIIQHLSDGYRGWMANRPPDATILANQIRDKMMHITHVADGDDYFLDFERDQILIKDPRILQFDLSAELIRLRDSQEISRIPIKIEINRLPMYDQIVFTTPFGENSLLPMLILNTSYEHPWNAAPERILRNIVEEVIRGGG